MMDFGNSQISNNLTVSVAQPSEAAQQQISTSLPRSPLLKKKKANFTLAGHCSK